MVRLIFAVTLAMVAAASAAFGITESWETDRGYLYREPALFAGTGALYDADAGVFNVLYDQPGARLARCDQTGCTSEWLQIPPIQWGRTYLFADDDGLFVVYRDMDANAIRILRETPAGWEVEEPDVDPCVSLGSAAARPDGGIGLFCTEEGGGNYLATDGPGGWTMETFDWETGGVQGTQTLAFTTGDVAHLVDLENQTDAVHHWREPGGEWQVESFPHDGQLGCGVRIAGAGDLAHMIVMCLYSTHVYTWTDGASSSVPAPDAAADIWTHYAVQADATAAGEAAYMYVEEGSEYPIGAWSEMCVKPGTWCPVAVSVPDWDPAANPQYTGRFDYADQPHVARLGSYYSDHIPDSLDYVTPGYTAPICPEVAIRLVAPIGVTARRTDAGIVPFAAATKLANFEGRWQFPLFRREESGWEDFAETWFWYPDRGSRRPAIAATDEGLFVVRDDEWYQCAPLLDRVTADGGSTTECLGRTHDFEYPAIAGTDDLAMAWIEGLLAGTYTLRFARRPAGGAGRNADRPADRRRRRGRGDLPGRAGAGRARVFGGRPSADRRRSIRRRSDRPVRRRKRTRGGRLRRVGRGPCRLRFGGRDRLRPPGRGCRDDERDDPRIRAGRPGD